MMCMKKKAKYKKAKFIKPSASEQEILNRVIVRIARAEEMSRYNELIENEHYLHSSGMVGERICYVAEYNDTWLALMSWSAGAYHLAHRDEWIGWTSDQRNCRLPFITNNSRFLVLSTHHYPNLASRCLRLCMARLSDDWQEKYDHPVCVAESFVDSQLFRGTVYKVSGWSCVGATKGHARISQEYYQKHDRPKQLWVCELEKGARKLLCQPELPECLKDAELKISLACRTKPTELETVKDCFEGMTEFRTGRIGYPLAGMMTLIFCAVLTGISRGQRDLAAYAATLTQAQLRALGFRYRDRKTRKLLPPKETTFFRILTKIDPNELEKRLIDCMSKLLGSPNQQEDQLIVIDGKALRSSNGIQIVSAFSVQTGRWLGSELIEEKSNEIPAARKLIEKIPIENAMILTDALHTQNENARKIVQELDADYFMTVKRNQKNLCATLDEILQAGQKNSFFFQSEH